MKIEFELCALPNENRVRVLCLSNSILVWFLTEVLSLTSRKGLKKKKIMGQQVINILELKIQQVINISRLNDFPRQSLGEVNK